MNNKRKKSEKKKKKVVPQYKSNLCDDELKHGERKVGK
jgi:hypothetical protein